MGIQDGTMSATMRAEADKLMQGIQEQKDLHQILDGFAVMVWTIFHDGANFYERYVERRKDTVSRIYDVLNRED